MGRLDGFSYREVAQRLRRLGYEPTGRQTGSHQMWARAEGQKTLVLPRHARDIRGGTLRAVLRQGGIDVDAFLAD